MESCALSSSPPPYHLPEGDDKVNWDIKNTTTAIQLF